MKVRAVIFFLVFLLSQFVPVSGYSSTDRENVHALHPHDNLTLSISYVQEGDSEGIFSRAISSHFFIGYSLPLPVNFPVFQIPKPPLSHVTEIGRHLQFCVLRN